MTATIDKAGRVVIPVEVRKRLGFTPGTELEIVIEGFALRLVRSVAGPEIVRRGERLVIRPRAAEGERAEVDVARLIEEERDRWPDGQAPSSIRAFSSPAASILAGARSTPCC